MAPPPRLWLSYRPRLFPKTVAKTCIALGLLLWFLYFYSTNYVYERRSSSVTASGGAAENRGSNREPEQAILRRPTVPDFEGIAEETSPNSAAVNLRQSTVRRPPRITTVMLPPDPATVQKAKLPQVNSVPHGMGHAVLKDLIRARKKFGYDKSITFTTHATYELLDNLIQLSRRWSGPISVAIYCPHTDLAVALEYSLWLRKCNPSVADFVTFHFVYPISDEVTAVTTLPEPSNTTECGSCRNASEPYDYVKVAQEILHNPTNSVSCKPSTTYPLPQSYRHRQRLPYPINVCRNVARINARTHFVLASDIELYPNHDVINMFLQLSRRLGLVVPKRARSPLHTVTVDHKAVVTQNKSNSLWNFFQSAAAIASAPTSSPLQNPRRGYVLPIFEVDKTSEVPSTKSALVELYRKKKAVYFHKYVCSFCNMVPRLNKWLTSPVPRGKLNIFISIQRRRPFNRWEPIYIGTNDEPLYDERLTWEGQQDKMTQMYELCLLNYDFAILDNAFLVHRPGIKTTNATEYKAKSAFIVQNNKMYKSIIKELDKKHGVNPLCK